MIKLSILYIFIKYLLIQNINFIFVYHESNQINYKSFIIIL